MANRFCKNDLAVGKSILANRFYRNGFRSSRVLARFCRIRRSINNPGICKVCYVEANSLGKRAFEVKRGKEAIKENIRKAQLFFIRRKRYHSPKISPSAVDSLPSSPVG